MLRLYLIKGMPFLGFINLSGGLGVLGEKAKVMPGASATRAPPIARLSPRKLMTLSTLSRIGQTTVPIIVAKDVAS